MNGKFSTLVGMIMLSGSACAQEHRVPSNPPIIRRTNNCSKAADSSATERSDSNAGHAETLFAQGPAPDDSARQKIGQYLRQDAAAHGNQESFSFPPGRENEGLIEVLMKKVRELEWKVEALQQESQKHHIPFVR